MPLEALEFYEREVHTDPDANCPITIGLKEWPECYAVGRTEDEALANLGLIYAHLVAVHTAKGWEIPRPTRDVRIASQS